MSYTTYSRPYKIGDHPSFKRAFPDIATRQPIYHDAEFGPVYAFDPAERRIENTVARQLRSRTGDRLGARGER